MNAKLTFNKHNPMQHHISSVAQSVRRRMNADDVKRLKSLSVCLRDAVSSCAARPHHPQCFLGRHSSQQARGPLRGEAAEFGCFASPDGSMLGGEGQHQLRLFIRCESPAPLVGGREMSCWPQEPRPAGQDSRRQTGGPAPKTTPLSSTPMRTKPPSPLPRHTTASTSSSSPTSPLNSTVYVSPPAMTSFRSIGTINQL